MTGPRGLREDDRGVSVALSHVLTMGITAVLIAGLLMGASAMLDGQSERGAERSLETIGERVASEVASVDRLAQGGADSAQLRVEHPSEVSGVTYSIEVQDGRQCSPPEAPLLEGVEKCLILSAPGARTTTRVPVVVKSGIDTGTSVQGGEMRIIYEDNEIRLQSGN